MHNKIFLNFRKSPINTKRCWYISRGCNSFRDNGTLRQKQVKNVKISLNLETWFAAKFWFVFQLSPDKQYCTTIVTEAIVSSFYTSIAKRCSAETSHELLWLFLTLRVAVKTSCFTGWAMAVVSAVYTGSWCHVID